jgi:hypothetical protein
MSQDAILGCFYLLNGLFAIRCGETQDLRPGATLSRPYGTQFGEGSSHAACLAPDAKVFLRPSQLFKEQND